MIRIAAYDLPGFVAGLQAGPLGKILAEPEAAEAWAIGAGNLQAAIRRWITLSEAVERVNPAVIDFDSRCERELLRRDWHDLQGIELCAIADRDNGNAISSCLVLEPTEAARTNASAAFEAMVKLVKEKADLRQGLELAAQQSVQEQHGLVLQQGSDADSPIALWAVNTGRQIVGSHGSPEISGAFHEAPAPQPALALDFDFGTYMRFMIANFGGPMPEEYTATQRLLGIEETGVLHWRVEVKNGLVQDELAIEAKTPFSGLIGALANGMAPMPQQPLPERALAQLFCAFDVPQLTRAVDEWLSTMQMSTLVDLGIAEDLRKAWSGGIAVAITRPAPMAVIPRLYVTFGIVDHAALTRLLTRLRALPGLASKDVTLEDQPGVQLKLEDAPAGLQPAFCVQKDSLHFAESGMSLRALLKAAANGAPRALDVGKAPRPRGKGAILPGTELRFDAAEIHSALQEIWLPLYEKLGRNDYEPAPILAVKRMPDVEVVTQHLGKGRGVLRQDQNQLVLSMLGPTGGPELTAMLSALGPFLSSGLTSMWSWRTENYAYELQQAKILKVQEALAAFEKRSGKRASSLGELLASGDLPEASTLLVEEEQKAEPVLLEGKELGKTSFRYFPDGVTVSPEGNPIKVKLIAISACYWRRIAVDMEGNLQQGWGDFAASQLDDVLKAK